MMIYGLLHSSWNAPKSRGSCWKVFFRITVHKSYTDFTQKHHLSNSLWFYLTGSFSTTLSKNGLHFRCFLGKFELFGKQTTFVGIGEKITKIENINVGVAYLSKRSFNKKLNSKVICAANSFTISLHMCLYSCYFAYMSLYLFIFPRKLFKAHMCKIKMKVSKIHLHLKFYGYFKIKVLKAVTDSADYICN